MLLSFSMSEMKVAEEDTGIDGTRKNKVDDPLLLDNLETEFPELSSAKLKMYPVHLFENENVHLS